jgi:hypothetical protein
MRSKSMLKIFSGAFGAVCSKLSPAPSAPYAQFFSPAPSAPHKRIGWGSLRSGNFSNGDIIFMNKIFRESNHLVLLVWALSEIQNISGRPCHSRLKAQPLSAPRADLQPNATGNIHRTSHLNELQRWEKNLTSVTEEAAATLK